MRIFLVGFMGCGKTTVGKPLAKALGFRFVDMDHYLTDKYHKTVSEIFEERGESGFRELERDTLLELSAEDQIVIATGGGAPCFFDNMDTMNRSGSAVYLQVFPEGLVKRLRYGRDRRPLIRGKSDEELLVYIEETLSKREVFYEKARIIVDCNGYSDAQIVDKCKRAIEAIP